MPDGRCDIIVRYNVADSTPPIPIITGPATRPYTVDYGVGDTWLGIRLRPDNGGLLWRQAIVNATDSVLRGEEAIALLPELAEVGNRDLSISHLAELSSVFKTPGGTDNRILDTLDVLHLSGGRIRVEDLSSKAGCSTRQLN